MNEREHNLDLRTPAELRPIEAAIEELAASERASAPDTLESRAFMASRGLLPADGAGVVVVRPRIMTRMRVAAAVALTGAGLAAWLAQPRGTANGSGDLAGLEQDVEFLLAVKSSGDDSTRQTIDELFLDTNSLGQSLRDIDWPLLDEGSL